MTRKNQIKRASRTNPRGRRAPARVRKKVNAKPAERGLGPDGGGWNIAQASAWSGIGEASLREMAKRSIATRDPTLFPCYLIGRRRILIPRQAFIDWFNRRNSAKNAA